MLKKAGCLRPSRRLMIVGMSSVLMGMPGLATQALAQDAFPTKAITLVVPNPPGGFVDTSARLLNEPLMRIIGQPVVIDNRPGNIIH